MIVHIKSCQSKCPRAENVCANSQSDKPITEMEILEIRALSFNQTEVDGFLDVEFT